VTRIFEARPCWSVFCRLAASTSSKERRKDNGEIYEGRPIMSQFGKPSRSTKRRVGTCKQAGKNLRGRKTKKNKGVDEAQNKDQQGEMGGSNIQVRWIHDCSESSLRPSTRKSLLQSVRVGGACPNANSNHNGGVKLCREDSNCESLSYDLCGLC
jgi:hypothetical protein